MSTHALIDEEDRTHRLRICPVVWTVDPAEQDRKVTERLIRLHLWPTDG